MSPPWPHVVCPASLHFFSSLIITAAVISTTGGTAATENPDSPLKYWLSHSTKIRPGMPLAVSVYLSNTIGTVTLRAELVDRQGKQLQDGQEFVLHGAGETETVYFNVSRSAVQRQRGSPYLRVRGEGGVVFDRVHRMMWDTKILSLFVQTDRAAYSPGQTVRFRTLALHDGLQVMHQPMDIEIRDPDNHLISKWSGVRSDDDTGVFEGDMTTSSHPPLGTWTIAVTVNDITEMKTFQLQDYDIPDFEVRLSLDRNYALVTDRAISGEITANFISGAPVVGIGTISAEMTKFPTIKHTLQKSFLLDLNGKANFTFSIDELRDLNRQTYLKRFPFFLRSWAALDYKTFRFTVTIPNGASGDVITDATSLKFYSILPLNVRFLPYSRESFKPGLPYDAYVEALRPNGLPADNSRGTSVSFVVTYRRRRVAQDGPSAEAIYSHSGGVSGGSVAGDVEYPLLEQDVTLDNEGVARLSIPSVPESAQRLRIYARVGRSNAVFYATRFVSPSDTFLQLSLIKHQRPKVGQPLKFVATCNKPFSTLTYQVYLKGLLLLTNTVDKYQAYRKRVLFSFNVTSSMTPTSDVIAFFKADDGEVVADRLAVGVPDVIESDVKLYLRHHEVEPGRRVKLMIRAAPLSTVFLLGQHKRLAADDGHDITLNDVMSELTRYGSGDCLLRQKTWFFTSPVHSAHDVFKTVHVGFIADGVVPGVEDNDVPSPLLSKSGLPLERGSDRMLKKFLPDTWLWNTVRLRGSNSSILTLKAPDTMADWVITAFAVHPTMGLSVARTPEELKDTKKLFITAELPDSAVLGEDVCFTALAYNLLHDPVEAWITLKKNASGFQNVLVSQDVKEPSVVTQAYKSVRTKTGLGTLKGKSLGAAQFCIKPMVLGHLPLKVVLRTGRRPDVLHKHIVIKSEGVLRRQWRPVLIQIDGPRPRFSQTVNIDVPRDVVPGTLTLSVGVVGDPMGLVADHLGDVLHTSHVNGEQNVITLAASAYLVSYLRHTGQLTPALLARARSFMLTGYQTQLSYRRQDGSFSIFGKEDPSGNVWLTAFVVKCLVQAASLGNDDITIDPAVISTAVQWMTKHQKRNGGFWDHGGHLGGKLKDVRLAAIVTIALKEVELNFFDNLPTSVQAKVTKALSKSVRYLESQLRRLRRDPYSVCIVAYALTLTGSKAARRVQNDLEKRVIIEGDLMHWSSSRKRKQKNTQYPWYRHADPHDIEMTSYALMTLIRKRSMTTEVTSQILTILTRKRARPDAGSVARWLSMQGGPFGGFVSTRDTVIALEALSRMTDMSSAKMFSPVDVEVSWTSDSIQTSSVTIDRHNHLTLQSVNVLLQDGYQPLEVTISANSSGTSKTSVFAQVLVEYHTNTNTRERVFSAKPTVSNDTATSFVLTTCVRRTSDVIAQAMVLTEIGIPSGYDVIRTASDYGSASHVEFVEGKVVLYYASLKNEESCSVLTMKMTRGVVALSRPIPVTVYDHSNPDDEVTTFYTIQQFGVCDLQHGYMSCPTSA